jgi:hypothetical protein
MQGCIYGDVSTADAGEWYEFFFAVTPGRCLGHMPANGTLTLSVLTYSSTLGYLSYRLHHPASKPCLSRPDLEHIAPVSKLDTRTDNQGYSPYV